MTTNEQNGHLAASRIEVEPTDRQRAAHELAEAFGAAVEIDWTAVETNFRVLAGAAGYESPVIEAGRTAAGRINETLLSGQEPLLADSTPYAIPWTMRTARNHWLLWTASPHATGRAGLSRTGSAELCRDAHGGRWCREVSTRASARLVPERRRALARRGSADARERGRLWTGL